MGIMPQPPDFGDNCGACFPPGGTPYRLKAFFAGIERGERWDPMYGAPPNGYYDIIQSAYYPCGWFWQPTPYPYVEFFVYPWPAHIEYVTKYGIYAFISDPQPICSSHFVNQYKTWSGNYFYGGYAFVNIPGWLFAQVDKVTTVIDPDPRCECFPISGGQVVVRYAGKQDGTNVSILVDT